MATEDMTHGGAHCGAKLRRATRRLLLPEELEEIERTVDKLAMNYLRKKADSHARPFENPLRDVIVADRDEAEKAASMLRETWNIGYGAIKSIYQLMENKGIGVVETRLPEDVLGISTWVGGRLPLVIMTSLSKVVTTERKRFTAAHELAMLLLTIPDYVDRERVCNQFAGCFLMPRQTLISELGEKRDRIGIEEMSRLRSTYGVSVSALVHQAYDLHIITKEHYNWWYDEIISKNLKETGWGKFPYI